MSLFIFVGPDHVLGSSPRFSSTTPAGAQRGTTLEVRFSGSRLTDAKEIVFHEPGIEVVRFNSVKDNRVKAMLKIADDCRLGEHHVRIRSATGISELRTFYVGPFPSVAEKEPNDGSAIAQEVKMGVTVLGNVPSEDVDCFLVEGKAGDRLSVEIEAMRLGRSAFDPYLRVEDSQGVLLGESDDTALLRQDGLVSIKLPRDGKYVVKVREASYGGSSSYLYRLHIGSFPRPLAVFPLGGPVGKRVEFRYIGDPLGDVSQALTLPGEVKTKHPLWLKQDGVVPPSPNWIRVSSFPNVMEVEPNNRREQATINFDSLPLAFNGIISSQGDEDWFRFSALKGQRLDLGVYARRLRSPLDPVLSVHDSGGKTLSSNDDGAGVDASLKFRVPSSGEYLLRVRDHLKDGGPDFTYRVEVTPSAPTISLIIPEVANNDTQTRQYIPVGKGNRFATLISARRSNYEGQLEFLAKGLPEGVTLHSVDMPASIDAMPLVFEASSRAPVRGRLTELVAKGEDGTEGGFRQRVELVRGPNNTTYYTSEVDQLYVAVTETVPFKLKLVQPEVPVVQNGTHSLKVLAQRYGKFTGAIRVKMLWNPPGIGASTDVTIEKGKSSVEYPLNASGDAATGTWPIAVLGSGSFGGGTVWASSQLAKLKVASPFLSGKIATASAEPGQSGKIVCSLDQKIPFNGKAKVTLIGLGDNIKVSSRQITKDSKQVVFDVKVDPKCRVGTQRGLYCSVEIQRNDGVVVQTIASGGKFRVVPPSKKGSRLEGKR